MAADLVILGIGGRPNTGLAKAAGLRLTDGGSIWVDSYMRTTDRSIFAVGDCALKRDFFTRKEMGLDVQALDMMQIATHPLLSPAPTVHPLITAAHLALQQMRSGTP